MTRAAAAIATDGSNVAARILMGNALAGLNDTTHALKEMEEAVALDPAWRTEAVVGLDWFSEIVPPERSWTRETYERTMRGEIELPHHENQIVTAARQMMIRVRSSVRCSTRRSLPG